MLVTPPALRAAPRLPDQASRTGSDPAAAARRQPPGRAITLVLAAPAH
jgi:hypothetical protein